MLELARQINQRPVEQKLLTGVEYHEDLLRSIQTANRAIFMQIFSHSCDEEGRKIGDALLEASQRGVDVTILADRIGAFYGFASGDQNYWHGKVTPDMNESPHNLNTIFVNGQAAAWFYGNGIVMPRTNHNRYKFDSIPNAHILDQYALFDHSKIALVDDSAWVGTTNIGHETFNEGWVDNMLKIKDPAFIKNMLSQLAYRRPDHNDSHTQFHSDSYLRAKEDSSALGEMYSFIRNTRDRAMVVASYCDDPDFAQAIIDTANAGKKVEILMPENPDVFATGNKVFISNLKKGDSRGNIDVRFSEKMIHFKGVLRDANTALITSCNSTMPGVFNEATVVTTDQQVVNELYENMTPRFDKAIQEMSSFGILSPLKFLLEKSALTVQTRIFLKHQLEIESARYEGRLRAARVLDKFYSDC